MRPSAPPTRYELSLDAPAQLPRPFRLNMPNVQWLQGDATPDPPPTGSDRSSAACCLVGLGEQTVAKFKEAMVNETCKLHTNIGSILIKGGLSLMFLYVFLYFYMIFIVFFF